MKGGDDMLGLLLFGAALVALDLVAHFVGVDSRDGSHWTNRRIA